MNIKKILAPLFAGDEIHQAVHGYELIGDIVLLSLSNRYSKLGPEMAREILRNFPQVRIVGRRVKGHNDEYRTTSLSKLGGCGDFTTIHKEFGIRLCVEPDKVYFSPRSGNERNRVTRQVVPGERVLVMFSGIGPLPLMMGLHTRASAIVGVEKNPDAYQLARKNLQLNPRVANVSFYQGDVRMVIPSLAGQFDRIVLPLPLSAERFIALALQKLKPEGKLHFYSFQYRGEFQKAAQQVVDAAQMASREVRSSTVIHCGHVGSRNYRVCVDATIS